MFLPFYQTFARRLLKWIPSRSEKLTRLLDKNMSQLPTVALEAVRRSLLEIERYLGNETELLDRIGYHIWRATRHLIKPTVPSERFDVNRED